MASEPLAGPFRAAVADDRAARDMHYFYISALISYLSLIDSQLEKRSHMLFHINTVKICIMTYSLM